MPPIKKMKSNSGWAQINLDFTSSSTTPERSDSQKKNGTNRMEIDDDNFPEIYVQRRDPGLDGILEACNPRKPAELVVSKQKQNEITNWLSSEGIVGRPRILVLSGPSGSGKTVALKVLAREHDFDVVEWISPIDCAYTGDFGGTRQSDKFFDFLVRASRYNSVFQALKPKLLIVKDIPNIFFIDRECFHDLLRQYMELGRQPVVFVCADSESSRVMHMLFPTDVVERFDIDRINVHAATPTAIKNMLKRVSGILNAKAGNLLNVTQSVIDEVLSNSIGDVRSTILNLIFASLKVPNNLLKNDCGSREESLGLLHGVGRVINPKRVETNGTWRFTHNPDDIAAYFASQSMVFLRFLQENYLNTMARIEEVDRCSEIMSLSDTIGTEYRDANLVKVNLSLCIRGVMVANQTPQTKWNPVRKPKSEDAEIQRDLGVAEERFYRSLISPKSRDKPLDPEFVIEA